jgi:hypothetical protein
LYVQEGLKTYLQENSSIASNRMIKGKNRKRLNYKRWIPVRYLDDSKIELFNKSPFKNKISRSTFYKYAKIDGEFKNPHRHVIKLV